LKYQKNPQNKKQIWSLKKE